MTFKKYFTELSIVILGITIAFLIENLNESRNQDDKIEKGIEKIILELNDHKDKMSTVTKFQDQILEDFADSTLFKDDDYALNIQKLRLTNGAYQTIIYNGVIGNIDDEVTANIINYYDAVESIKLMEKYLFDEVNNNVRNENERIDMVVYWVAQLNGAEKGMLEANQKLSSQLGSIVND